MEYAGGPKVAPHKLTRDLVDRVFEFVWQDVGCGCNVAPSPIAVVAFAVVGGNHGDRPVE